MTITPTLIIGVGTSGLAMINTVRELFFEEFTYAGLPLVRFLHISTSEVDEPFTLENTNFINDFEKIQIAKAYLNDAEHQVLSQLVNSESLHYDKEIAKWLNPMITNIPGKKFNAGAGNIRQAGRLCLWRNWNNVTTNGIFNAYGKIVAADSVRETTKIMRDYYTIKGLPVDSVSLVQTAPFNIYVVGTLVGGTCSGMFIDLGFYLANQFPAATIYGVFSTMDNNIAGDPGQIARAANNHAALVELDYYMQYFNNYDYQLPNNFKVSKGRQPFNFVSLLTTTNKNGDPAAVISPAGDVDVNNLNRLVGLSIFFDIIAGAGNEKEQIKIDYEAKLGTGCKSEVFPHYGKRFFVPGSSALWFPKNKIAGYIAINKILEFANYWSGDAKTKNINLANREADILFNKLDSVIRKTIVKYNHNGVDVNIYSDIQTILAGVKNIHEQHSAPYEQILANYPEENTPALIKRFSNDGYYYCILNNNLHNVKNIAIDEGIKIFKSKINTLLNSYPGDKNTRSIANLIELHESIDILTKRIFDISANSTELHEGDVTISDLNIDEYFEALANEEKRKSTAWAFSKDKILKQHEERIFARLNERFDYLFTYIVDYFVAKCFTQILNELKSSLLEEIIFIQKKIDNLKDEANSKQEGFLPSSEFAALKYVYQTGDFNSDVEFYTNKFDNLLIKQQFATIGNAAELSDLFRNPDKSEKQILGDLIIKIQRLVFQNMRLHEFDLLNTETTPMNVQINIAQLSVPLFQPDRKNYQPITIPTQPTLIAGGIAKSRKSLMENLKGFQIKFDREIAEDLKHIVYFYQEDGMVAINEFDVFSILKNQYIKHSSSPDSFGMHIDKNPTKFDITIEDLKEAIKKDNLLKVACDLFKRDLFIAEGNDPNKGYFLIYEYYNRNNKKVKLYYPINDPNYFINQLTSINEARDQFNQKFNNLIEKLGRQGFDDRVDQYLSELEKKGNSPLSNFYISEQKFYQEYAAKKYPNQTNDGDGNFAGATNIKHFNAPANNDETTFDEATITEFKGQNGNN